MVVTAQTIEPRNKIAVVIQFHLSKTPVGSLKYGYSVLNSVESKQDVWKFRVVFSCPRDSITKSFSIPGWWGPDMPTDGPPYWVSWTSPKENMIKPGNKLIGLELETRLLPGITDYYAEGYDPPPSFPEGMAPDSIPGYDDLTPYGPGIVGKTVGPVLPPTPFVALAFLDTLTSYKHQAFALGWIKNQGIVQSLDAKLDNAKAQLNRNNKTAARNTLQAFLNEVEALWKGEEHPYGGKQITSEAYALLKFNAEYLVSKL
jgi:hypothetical protein